MPREVHGTSLSFRERTDCSAEPTSCQRAATPCDLRRHTVRHAASGERRSGATRRRMSAHSRRSAAFASGVMLEPRQTRNRGCMLTEDRPCAGTHASYCSVASSVWCRPRSPWRCWCSRLEARLPSPSERGRSRLPPPSHERRRHRRSWRQERSVGSPFGGPHRRRCAVSADSPPAPEARATATPGSPSPLTSPRPLT